MGLEPGTVLQDTYRIVGPLASGGMGEVFEATHARLAGRYAVKTLLKELADRPEIMKRFQREAEVTSSLRHPNIVQVIDFNSLPDGTPYLVMELLEGESLADFADRSGPLPLPVVTAIIEQVASGLAAAHSLGVVHRDLKPANIFLATLRGQEASVAKVLDFGISKVKAAATALTNSSMQMGTPNYMSPEQATGKSADTDAATDQFALAAITYELLSGNCAFDAPDTATVVYKIMFSTPSPLAHSRADLPPAVDGVIDRGLAKKREDRFPDVMAFARALRQAGGGNVTAASIPAVGSSPGQVRASAGLAAAGSPPRPTPSDVPTQPRRPPPPSSSTPPPSSLTPTPSPITRTRSSKAGLVVAVVLGTLIAVGIVAAALFGSAPRP